MTNTLRLKNLFLLFTLTLALAACGGGGGGGGDRDSNNSSTDSNQNTDDNSNNNTGSSYAQQFNPYMPLANMADFGNASVTYFDKPSNAEFSATQSYNTDVSEIRGTDVYTFTLGDISPITFYFSSSPEKVLLYRFDANIEFYNPIIGGPSTLINLKFKTPVTVYDPTKNIETQNIEAYAQVGNDNYTVIMNTKRNSNRTQFDGDYGFSLPTMNNAIEFEITALKITDTVDFPFDNPVTIKSNVYLTKGIGPLEVLVYAITGGNETNRYNSEIASLNNLPQTIWFERNNAEPILKSSSAEFSTSEGPIQASEFIIANLEEINALGWITISEATSGTYVVAMQNHPNLPTGATKLEELTSIEVVFERRSDGKRLSGNVTLLPD